MAFHVSRPGAEAERAMFAQAVLDVLGTEQSAVTQSFLIGLLQLAGKDEAVPALSSRLKDAQLCEPATQALLCIKTPAATQALIEALPAAKEGNRGTIIRALGVLRVNSAVDAILPSAAAADVNTRHMA
ncbi:MAG TPA: hypothetical protein VHP11_05605, partial [Tepidisphaeraceae bacterium]|nr:hypothetical protein [Tepidisphaeraceae bacterium]